MQISLNYPNNQLFAMVLVGLKMTAIDFHKLNSDSCSVVEWKEVCNFQGSIIRAGTGDECLLWEI